MKIVVIGGIFGSPAEFRRTALQQTTETILAEGLKRRGHDVITDSHRMWNSWPHDTDVVHIHHLANSCVQLPVRWRSKIVFTRHATKRLPRHHALVLAATQRCADRMVALSEAEADLITRQGVPASTVSVIHNGIRQDLTSADRRHAPTSGAPFRLLYVGQLIELKRVHLCLDLLERLRAGGIDARLDVVSQRPTLLTELQAYAERLGVDNLVTWHEPKTQRQVADMMAASHALLLPSRTEALSTVITEACIAGLPVLAFHVGGVREQVPNGWATPPPNQTQEWLQLGVQALSEYDLVAERFIDHAPTAARRFSIDNMLDLHEQLYGEVLQS